MIIYILSGVFTGFIVLGVGGRLVMHIIALNAGIPSGFSWGGSLEVIAFGTLLGMLSAPFLALMIRIRSGKKFIPLIFSLLLFAVLIAVPFESKNAARSFPEDTVLILFLFGSLLILFGYGLQGLSKWLSKHPLIDCIGQKRV